MDLEQKSLEHPQINVILTNNNKLNFQKIPCDQIIKELKKKDWYIDSKKYQKYDWKYIFEQIFECKAEKLYLSILIIILYYNQYPPIIKNIQHIFFSNLKQVKLDGNKIDNIQPLGWINWDHLELLNLVKNQISQIKCFRKISLSSLNKLFLNKNPIVEISSLTFSKINPDKFTLLALQYCMQVKQISEDLSALIKLNCQLLLQIFNQSKSRINQQKLYKLFKLRFPQIIIKNH